MPPRVWSGREWQDYCVELVRIHYGPTELQEMPDRHDGDRGIEAFSRDGCAFQCYAADEPKTTAELYEDQRDKLTADLGKLKRNESDLKRIFSTTKIRRYVFMIHRIESTKLVQHAATKAAEVRGWGLSFIARDFEVHVGTDDAYSDARAKLRSIPSTLFDVDAATEDDIKAWSLGNGQLVAVADRKLTTLGLSPRQKARYSRQLLQSFLDGENALERIRSISPDMWTQVARAKARKERALELEHPAGEHPRPTDVAKIMHATAADFQAAAPTVTSEHIKTLAWSSVADWIFRCPLEFDTEADEFDV